MVAVLLAVLASGGVVLALAEIRTGRRQRRELPADYAHIRELRAMNAEAKR